MKQTKKRNGRFWIRGWEEKKDYIRKNPEEILFRGQIIAKGYDFDRDYCSEEEEADLICYLYYYYEDGSFVVYQNDEVYTFFFYDGRVSEKLPRYYWSQPYVEAPMRSLKRVKARENFPVKAELILTAFINGNGYAVVDEATYPFIRDWKDCSRWNQRYINVHGWLVPIEYKLGAICLAEQGQGDGELFLFEDNSFIFIDNIGTNSYSTFTGDQQPRTRKDHCCIPKEKVLAFFKLKAAIDTRYDLGNYDLDGYLFKVFTQPLT